MSPFDFLNSINSASKKSLFDGCNALEEELNPDSPSKSYVPFVINRSLSYFQDTILLANEMNINPHLDSKLQNDFLLNTIRKNPKRFSKWNKTVEDDSLEAVKEYYGYSNEKAKSIMTLLSPEAIEIIKQRMYKGGTK